MQDFFPFWDIEVPSNSSDIPTDPASALYSTSLGDTATLPPSTPFSDSTTAAYLTTFGDSTPGPRSTYALDSTSPLDTNHLPDSTSLSDSTIPLDSTSSSSSNPANRPRKKPAPPKPCPHCSKLFSEKHRYNKHVKAHGTAFKCLEEGCNVKGFSCSKDLNRHVLTHRRRDGMRNQYFCEFVDCEYSTKGFARHDGLLRHRRGKHASDSR
ncbi:hypothetical protein BDR22DRAFT_225380 [Usnea florida]